MENLNYFPRKCKGLPPEEDFVMGSQAVFPSICSICNWFKLMENTHLYISYANDLNTIRLMIVDYEK